MRTAILTAVVVLLTAAPSPPGLDAVDLDRTASAAYAAGRYDEAARLWEQAEGRATDPGRIAFNKAAALFHQGRYRDAERAYRCVLDNPLHAFRKARSHYNLGTCLLLA